MERTDTALNSSYASEETLATEAICFLGVDN